MNELGRPFVVEWRDAIRDSDLPRTTKLVAHTLATYMTIDGTTGPESWRTPSIVTLARGASLGRKNQKDNTAVKDAIARLEVHGLLEVDRRRGQRGWIYEARIPRAAEGLNPPWGRGIDGKRIPRADGNESPALASGIPRPGGGELEVQLEEQVVIPRAARARGKRGRAYADPFKDLNLEGYDRA